MQFRLIQPTDNPALAKILRGNLKANGLDIPGTAYFDDLEHLSDFYQQAGRDYLVALNDAGEILGGGGFAEYLPDQGIAELQKLYLADTAKGQGVGYRLVRTVEVMAREAGYQQMYLETHHALKPAMHLYEEMHYQLVPEPLKTVVHQTMDRFYVKSLIKS